MRSVLLLFTCIAFLCFMAGAAAAVNNTYGKWVLHDVGEHNAKLNTCAFVMGDCWNDAIVSGRTGAGREDIYVIAGDVEGIAGTRFGICCDGPVFFYGWTGCSAFDIGSTGWPGCGEGMSSAWSGEQPGPNVTVGVLDAYIYGSTHSICVCVDPRVDYVEWCDGTEPLPECLRRLAGDPYLSSYFGCIGFNGEIGFNPCGLIDPVHEKSWGEVKSLYR